MGVWDAAVVVANSSVMTFFWREKAAVRVVAISGGVKVSGEKVTMTANEGFVLKAGDWLLTEAGGAAEVEFPGEATRLRIGEESEFGVVRALPGKELKLTSGSFHASVARQSASHPMLVRTPTAKAEVLGTEFEMKATKERTEMRVVEGRVLIAREKDENGVVVEARQSAMVVETAPVKVTAAAADVLLKDGLLARWSLNEGAGLVAEDASGHQRALRLSAADAWGVGKLGGGMDWYRGRADVLSQPLRLPASFSVALWLRIEPGGAARAQPVLSLDGRAAGLAGLFVTLRPTFPGSGITLDVPGPTMGSEAHSEPGVIRAGEWHQVILTVDAKAGRAEFFVDGRWVTQAGGLRQGFEIGGPLLMGRRVPGGPLPFDGQMDEVRLYDHALSEAEVAELSR